MVDDVRSVSLHEGVAHGEPGPQHDDQAELRAMWSCWSRRNKRCDLIRENLGNVPSDAPDFVAGEVAVAKVGEEAVELGVENAGGVEGEGHVAGSGSTLQSV